MSFTAKIFAGVFYDFQRSILTFGMIRDAGGDRRGNTMVILSCGAS